MISIIIGNQGAGKSSYAVCKGIKFLKKGYPVFCNLPMKGAYKFDKDDLMVNDFPPNSVLIFDEGATYGLGSRGNLYKKNTTENLLEFFTTHRHYNIAHVIIVSPNFNDVLPAVRDNATEIILVTCGLLGILFGLPSTRKIKRCYEIGEKEHDIKYGYFWKPFSRSWFKRSKAYAFYDSWVSKDLAKKDWELYSTFPDLENVSLLDNLKSKVKELYVYIKNLGKKDINLFFVKKYRKK